MQIKVSVLVPIYNVEKYLKQCLDSIINQTLKELEIICINDGSTDNSLSILQEYANMDNRIIIINKNNSGYGASLNLGLAQASGEYIGIIEPDDFANKNMYYDLYNLANKFDADMVKSNYYRYYSEKNVAKIKKDVKKSKAGKLINIFDYPDFIKKNPAIWSGIYKNNTLKKYNIKFLETPGASYQDVSFHFKTVAVANRLVLTDKAYIYYRLDNENSSVKSTGKIYVLCDEYFEIKNFLNKNPNLKMIFNSYRVILEYLSYKWNARRIAPEFRVEFIQKFYSLFKQYEKDGDLDRNFFKSVDSQAKLLLKSPEKYTIYISKSASNKQLKFKFLKIIIILKSLLGINKYE